MWKRMYEPWLILGSLADLVFSFAMAYLFANVMGWRYLDWLGLNAQPFSESGTILTYTLLGALLWPVLGLFLWLAAGDLMRNYFRSQVRIRMGSHT